MMKKRLPLLLAVLLCLFCVLAFVACGDDPADVCQHTDTDGNALCDKCGASYTDNTNNGGGGKKPCTTHVVMYYEPKEPTCNTIGYIEFWVCTACDKYFSDEDATVEIVDKTSVTIAATGIHSLIEDSTDTYLKSTANCESPAVYHYKCEHCGFKSEQTYTVGAQRHDFTARSETPTYLKSAASCRSCAVYYYKCSLCDKHGESTYEVGNKLEHEIETINNKEVCTKCSNTWVYFGEYPQTLKAPGVSITQTMDSRGYYLGSDNAYYAMVTADPYGNYKFSDNSDIVRDTVYYFKVEPIRWLVLRQSNDTALLLCDSIIANGSFDGSNNNYAESDVRNWLNDEFYNKAFGMAEAQQILSTTVDSSAASTSYDPNQNACENTSDKIFLLSCAEVRSYDGEILPRASRKLKASDYSLANGVQIDNGNGSWWLRSPDNVNSQKASYVTLDGNVHISDVSYSYIGLIPALQIRL